MTLRIAIPLFPGFAATDAIGPYEILARLPQAEVAFVSTAGGLVAADTGFLRLETRPMAGCPDPDLLLVPGAPNRFLPLGDATFLDYLRHAAANARWTASVCTGALLLGAAGLLRGRRATTHWMDRELLAGHGAELAPGRVVFDGNLVTAAGVTAGYDMALALAARIAGEDFAMAVQLALEYAPEPPFAAGSPDTAPAHLVAAVRAHGLAGRPA